MADKATVTTGSLVWVPAPPGDAGDRAWLKAEVLKVAPGSSTAAVRDEDGRELEVDAAGCPLQNPAARMGVEVRSFFFSHRRGLPSFFEGSPTSRPGLASLGACGALARPSSRRLYVSTVSFWSHGRAGRAARHPTRRRRKRKSRGPREARTHTRSSSLCATARTHTHAPQMRLDLPAEC